jgi:hypothetical protein
MLGSINVGRMAEEVCHLIMNREKTVGLPSRLEALHDALASSQARQPHDGAAAVLLIRLG